jgi:hypothetical protein
MRKGLTDRIFKIILRIDNRFQIFANPHLSHSEVEKIVYFDLCSRNAFSKNLLFFFE